jgi:hypothetical protein
VKASRVLSAGLAAGLVLTLATDAAAGGLWRRRAQLAARGGAGGWRRAAAQIRASHMHQSLHAPLKRQEAAGQWPTAATAHARQ